jgi:hypothetical protein
MEVHIPTFQYINKQTFQRETTSNRASMVTAAKEAKANQNLRVVGKSPIRTEKGRARILNKN